MVRDKEIKRLIKYAAGLGANVTFKRYVKGSRESAAWEIYEDSDSAVITVYIKSRQSKLETILSLIHEIGHHKDYIDGHRRIGRYADIDIEGPLTPEQRKEVLDQEIRGTRYWKEIYKDTGCTFPIERLYLQMEMDIWIYIMWCKTNRPLPKSLIDRHWKSLKEKHKRGY